MKIQHLIAAACLSSLAAFTFAQTADAPKPAPVTNNWSPSYATAPPNGATAKPYTPHAQPAQPAKPTKHVKKAQKAKHPKAKKASHSKAKKAKHKKAKATKHRKARKARAAG